MKRARIASLVATVVFSVALASCGKQEEAKVEKIADRAAADVKAKAEADARAAEDGVMARA